MNEQTRTERAEREDIALQRLQTWQRGKLEDSAYKIDWLHGTDAHWRVRLAEETLELDEAIDYDQPPWEVWREAADVANIVMFRAFLYELAYYRYIAGLSDG